MFFWSKRFNIKNRWKLPGCSLCKLLRRIFGIFDRHRVGLVVLLVLCVYYKVVVCMTFILGMIPWWLFVRLICVKIYRKVNCVIFSIKIFYNKTWACRGRVGLRAVMGVLGRFYCTRTIRIGKSMICLIKSSYNVYAVLNVLTFILDAHISLRKN